MYIINQSAFYEALRRRGFDSLQELADFAGVHRNTIHYYLSGKRVLSPKLEKIIRCLNSPLSEIVRYQTSDRDLLDERVAKMIDLLHAEYPRVTFILFGSRTTSKAGKYSDYDLGAYSTPALTTEQFLNIYQRKCELEEDLPFFIDLVNLHNADDAFLAEIGKNWQFLTGKLSDWNLLQKKVRNGRRQGC